jgi:hypothetical protein
MNWKWMVPAVAGTFAGMLFAPFAQKTVSASVAPVSAHFQIQDATVDEPNGQGQNVPAHEVFLLDTESGTVWQFQGLVWARGANGNDTILAEPSFHKVPVLPVMGTTALPK